MPPLKDTSASGMWPAGNPASARAPAKPKPCSSPNATAIAHGKRRSIVGRSTSRASSTASVRTLSAIRTSTGRDGTFAACSAAADRVRLWPSVKAVIVCSSSREAETRSRRVDSQVVGTGGEGFHVIGLVEYPSRQTFLEIATDPHVEQIGVHRAAGLESQWLIAATAVASTAIGASGSAA